MRFRNSLLFCCLVLPIYIILPLQAQYLQKPVRVLTTKDGLPQSFISGLVQDKDGFVWAGTRSGLVRYDGIHFKLFRHSNSENTSIASNLIVSLFLDNHNHIWIEHESSAIDCLDPVTERIEHITARPLFRQHPIIITKRGWLADSNGNLWCVQKWNGLYKYDWQNNKATHFTAATGTFASDTVRGLLQDKQQNIWVINQRGISRIDATTGAVRRIPVPGVMEFNTDPNLDAEIIAVRERRNGEIIFGDRRQLYFYHPQKNTWRTIPLPRYSKLGIHSLQTGPDGYEYLESDGWVYRYDDRNGLVAVGDIGLTAFRGAQSFLVDASGLIWLGTNAAGIHQINLSAPFFESQKTVVSFHYDLLHRQFGIALDQVAAWPLSDKEFNVSSYYFRSAYDAQSRLWIALRDRVNWYDTSQNQWMLLPPVPGVGSNSIPAWGIRGISFAPDGRLWVVSDHGYIRTWDTIHQQWETFLDISGIRQTNPNFSLNDIVAQKDKLWITTGSREGLLCIDIRSKQVKQFNQEHYPNLFPTDQLLGFKRDLTRPNLLWIGSYEGLICLNKKTLKSEVFSIDKGLPDNTIYAIQADEKGYLWLSTNKGLCRFHPVTHEVRIFGNTDGLPGDEFNRFHSMRLPDGRLAFGGPEGWTLFDPTHIKDDNYQPPVAFTSIRINNLPVSHLDTASLLPAPLNSLITLALPYDQNTLAFDFAGLEFSQPRKLSYRYQLKGYDDDWIVSNIPNINYTKLPPGHYVLKINVTNTTGQWSPHIRTLAVVIRPPFWRTWWAYGLYVLLLAGLVWAYIQYRLKQERLRQEMTLKEQEASQLKSVDELKSRFFSNVTHEFRTPLTLILTPAQRLKAALHHADHQRWVGTIERNSLHLLRLINQLLDFSKIESGTMKVNEAIGNVPVAIEEMLHSFRSETETSDTRLQFKTNLQNENYWFDADKLEQIVHNLVANALKFTPDNGIVEVDVSDTRPVSDEKNTNLKDPSSKGVIITVSDTGTGIPPAQLPHIFRRFYQADNYSGEKPVAKSKSSGIGLSLVKELIELQRGTIEVYSPVKAGGWSTCFTVWLPYRSALATDEPIAELPLSAVVTGSATPHLPDTPLNDSPTDEEEKTATILLIEDNDELAEFIADSLPKSYSVGRAANGAEGLDAAYSLVPDLVISDVLMPVMDGFECCRRLKEDERTNHIPVILLTAKASFDNRIEGLKQGADDYLTKPFHIQELQLRVANLLDRQRRIREKLQIELSHSAPVKTVAEAKPPEDVTDAFIEKLHALVEENLDDVDFGVEELARGIGMSRTNLHRKIKAVAGLVSGDIIRNYRLKRAAQFLKEGFNSSEVAYRSGFSSPPYFSKCFREMYGVTPLEFIQQA